MVLGSVDSGLLMRKNMGVGACGGDGPLYGRQEVESEEGTKDQV
jgi:hypothetical protein